MEPSQKTIEMVFGFPKAGEVYGSFDVVSSNFDADKGTWSVLFSDKLDKQHALQALKPFLGKVAVFEVDGAEHSVEFPTNNTKVEHVRTNPPSSVQTLVHGRFHGNTAFQNPTTVEAFEEELGKMTVKKPTKWFRVHPITELHSPSFRNKLWSFVTRRGESYGWVVGKQIYHRKGSLIMPYVKINKHVENAKVMYHTHPSKDEPSFSSADDIQWYLDAAYKWGIRHYYTVMENRLDHFEITTKGDKGRNSYLRMDEGKFIEDLDNMLSKLEEQYKGDALSDEKFCEKVTRKWVQQMNDRFGHIMSIKYHSHIKKETPLKNPGSGIPLGVSKRIALDDRHISTALGELKGLDYDWIHYGGDEFAHTMYVYWWSKYHFLPKADGKDRLYNWEGLSKEGRVKLREYLATEIEAGWNRADVLLMLALYHDIAKRREKEEKRHHSVIGAQMFKEEIAPEIGLSQNLTDHVTALLESDVGRRGISEEEFMTIASDLYIVCKLFHMADRTAHHPYMFTSAAATARQEGLLQTGQYGDAYITMRNKEDIALVENLLMNNIMSNPPPKMPYTVKYNASYEIAIDPDTAEMLFEEYDPRKVVGNDGKYGDNFRMSYGQGIYLRLPLSDGYIATASLGFAYPAKLNLLSIPVRDDYGVGAAIEVYNRVAQVLAQVYDVKSEELSEPSSDTTSETEATESPEADVLPAANVSFPVQPMINPKHCKNSVRGAGRQPSQSTIVIAGPMGSGRREVAKELGRHGYQICPMHTTQPSPVGRVPNRDSVDHDKVSFMQLVKADQMPYWVMDEKGHCYGYTKEQLQAPKTVMYTSPTMALRMKDSLPHLHIVYLQNNQSPQQHEMKLSSRSGITPRQAKAASRFAYHQKRKASQFDTVVPIDDDDYMNAATVLKNSNFFPGEAVNKYPWLKSADLISQTVSISKLNPHGGAHRVPRKFVGQDPSLHSDLYTDEDPKGTIKGLGFKDKETAERSVNIIKRSGKTHAHKMQAAMAMEQRARFHPNATPGIKAAQKVYANFIEQMKKKTKRNPPTFSGIKEAHEHYNYPGSHRTGTIIKDGIVIRSYSNNAGHDIVKDDGDTIQYMIKTPKIRTAFLATRKQGEPLRFFLKTGPSEVTDMGMYEVGRLSGKFVNLVKAKENPPLTFEEIIPVIFEISEDRQYTLFNRLIKLMEESGEIAEEVLIKEGFKPYKEPGKDGVEGEITDAIVVLLMAFERNGGTPEELKDLLYKSISKGGMKLKRNPSKTPEGRKIPKRYLKGLNKEEMIIAAKEIDKGYKYDINDPKAYEYWKSDIKATARGYKTVPSKYKKKFIQMYGPLPKGGKFLTKIAKATGIKKSILQKVYNKGLAAWRGGHRPGVQQHQWAAGRVYSFVTLGNTVKKGNKKMPDHSLAIEAGLIKANPRKGNKPTLEEFRQWVDQVNMKNKEIKAFMESDWFDEAGLTPEEAGEQGIFSGQDSLRRIIRMRKKLGLTGPKDYIKSGPQITKKYYELALEKWTGLDSSVPIKEDTTDWGWMLRQNRFNGRASAYPYNKAAEKRRGPLVKKQKTQNKPSRKLLSLWVWGHDPWRWARKNGVANMPKCADVPWVGMTEKRKYGKVPVLMSPTVKKNPELAIPPFGLAFVPQTEVKGILKEGIKAQDGVVPLIYPFPNWKGKILPALYEKVKETPMKDIALLKINHPLSQGMKADSDVAYYHKGSVKPSQIENIVKWWDSIDFESGQITDTKEYREWMDASGIELILTIKQNPVGRKVMYHGSSIPNINRLQQNYNHLVGREVVFATPNYEYALAMAIDSTNDDLEIGYINGQFTIAEVYEGAFELLKEPSYIYEIKANGFHQHPRLPEMEYIIETSMPVLKSKRVPNTYKELKRLGTTFIPYR